MSSLEKIQFLKNPKIGPHKNYVVRNIDNTKQNNKTFINWWHNKTCAEQRRKRSYAKQNSLPLNEHLGEDILEKLTQVKLWVEEELMSRGTGEMVNAPMFLMDHSKKDKTDNQAYSSAAKSCYMVTGIGLYENIRDVNIRQLQFLKTLAHEFYHMGRLFTWYYANGDCHLERIGIGQRKNQPTARGKRYPTAIEEGLAVEMELRIFEKIKTLFPEEVVKKYYKIRKKAAHSESQNSIPEALRERIEAYEREDNSGIEQPVSMDLYIVLSDGDNPTSGQKIRGYQESYDLVRFLADNIPNFYTLIEPARIDGQILPLKEAVESVFGGGSYEMISSAFIGDSVHVLEKLRSSINLTTSKTKKKIYNQLPIPKEE